MTEGLPTLYVRDHYRFAWTDHDGLKSWAVKNRDVIGSVEWHLSLHMRTPSEYAVVNPNYGHGRDVSLSEQGFRWLVIDIHGRLWAFTDKAEPMKNLEWPNAMDFGRVADLIASAGCREVGQ